VVNPWISTRIQKDGQLAAEFSIPEQRLLTIEERPGGVCTFGVYRTTNYAIVLSVVCVTLHVSSNQQCVDEPAAWILPAYTGTRLLLLL
jgi:hypothetical protein